MSTSYCTDFPMGEATMKRSLSPAHPLIQSSRSSSSFNFCARGGAYDPTRMLWRFKLHTMLVPKQTAGVVARNGPKPGSGVGHQLHWNMGDDSQTMVDMVAGTGKHALYISLYYFIIFYHISSCFETFPVCEFSLDATICWCDMSIQKTDLFRQRCRANTLTPRPSNNSCFPGC